MGAKKDLLMFDVDAWFSDVDVQSLSREDRCSLLESIFLAHKGKPKGYLINGGNPIKDKALANMFHITADEWQETKKNLIEAGRIGIAEHNKAMFIPRMVKYAQILAASTEAGKRGGNPDLIGEQSQKLKRSTPITAGYYYGKLPLHLSVPTMKEAVAEWIEYRQRKRLILTTAAVTREINILKPLSPEQACSWIRCAIDKNWRGFYQPPANWEDPVIVAEKRQKEQNAKQAKRQRQQLEAQFNKAVDSVVEKLLSCKTAEERDAVYKAAGKKYDKLGELDGNTIVGFSKEIYAMRKSIQKKRSKSI